MPSIDLQVMGKIPNISNTTFNSTLLSALESLDHSSKVLVITSSVSGEGKSTLSAEIAKALSSKGKTLAVDCDLRRPTLTNILSTHQSVPGLSELIGGFADYSSVLCASNYPNLSVIPSGTSVANADELLTSPRLPTIVEQLKSDFRYIVIDSPPVKEAIDSQLLAPLTDELIYVVNLNVVADIDITDSINKLVDSIEYQPKVLINNH